MVRLLIADSIRASCEAMGMLLDTKLNITVVATLTSVDTVLEYLTEKECDVVLINVTFPNQAALKLTELINKSHPDVQVLILGLEYVEALILQYIELGAAGYILRDESFESLIEKIYAAPEERALVAPEIAAALIERVATLGDRLSDLGVDPADYEQLTTREEEVLALIAEGLTNKEIGSKLFIETGTVKNHVHSILEKLNVGCRQDAAVYRFLMEHKENPPD